MVARNGIADGTLVPVPGEPGARLRVDAAESWERLCAAVRRRYGWTPRLTSAGDAFRPYAVQERIFRQRYTPAAPTTADRVGKRWDSDGDGTVETWWRLPVYATAATPGTSNHGWGVACDVTGLGGFAGTRYQQFATVALEHGWDNVEGRSIAEAWHWRYRPENDRHRGASPVTRPVATVGDLVIPGAVSALPAPLAPEVTVTALPLIIHSPASGDWLDYGEGPLIPVGDGATSAAYQAAGAERIVIANAGDLARIRAARLGGLELVTDGNSYAYGRPGEKYRTTSDTAQVDHLLALGCPDRRVGGNTFVELTDAWKD